MSAVEHRRRATPVRVSVARALNGDIDGAWWPRVDRLTVELPHLVAVLSRLLGEVRSINVNWPQLERPPDINWPGWEQKRQHVMALEGAEASIKLLIVPYSANSGLALMILRSAAELAIDPADRAGRLFGTAESIVKIARQQQICGYPVLPKRTVRCPRGPEAV